MKVMQREETVWGLIQDVLRMSVEGKITEQKEMGYSDAYGIDVCDG